MSCWGVGSRLKLDAQRQGGGRILDVHEEGGGWEVLKIGQISWTSCVYYPTPEIKWNEILNL